MSTTAATGTISALELRRLANGVIWPGFLGTTAPQWLLGALGEGLAGVVYFSQNLDPGDPGQPAALSAQLRTANPAAVIGADEEGGNVTRLQSRDGSDLPGAGVLGRVDDISLTEAAGRALGLRCAAAGINLVLAPVADVNTNPLNPVIGIRSFGSRPAHVARHTAALVRGIQSTGVGACAKHFPGHGDTSTDSHLSLPRLDLALDEVARDHLPPFAAAVEAGVSAVMSAHIVVPGLGKHDGVPATLNPAAAALLRGLGFDGLLVTDALDMAAIRATVGVGQGAVAALLAGADLLCVGNPGNPAVHGGSGDEERYREVLNALLAAVADGSLPVEVLRRASARVAAFAQSSLPAPDLTDPVEPTDWTAVARAALDVVPAGAAPGCGPHPDGLLPRIPPRGTVLFADLRGNHNIAAGSAGNFFAAALARHVDIRTVSAGGLKDLADAAEQPAAVVLLADGLAGPADGSQRRALAAAATLFPAAVCINAGIAADAPAAVPILNCHGSSRVTARAAAGLLLGH